jgi:hypothetical protein
MWLRTICLYLRHLNSVLSEEPPGVFIEQTPNHVLELTA